jgi:hypothetical protein
MSLSLALRDILRRRVSLVARGKADVAFVASS